MSVAYSAGDAEAIVEAINYVDARLDAAVEACNVIVALAIKPEVGAADLIRIRELASAVVAGAPAPSVNSELLAACRAAREELRGRADVGGSSKAEQLCELLDSAMAKAENGGVA